MERAFEADCVGTGLPFCRSRTLRNGALPITTRSSGSRPSKRRARSQSRSPAGRGGLQRDSERTTSILGQTFVADISLDSTARRAQQKNSVAEIGGGGLQGVEVHMNKERAWHVRNWEEPGKRRFGGGGGKERMYEEGAYSSIGPRLGVDIGCRYC